MFVFILFEYLRFFLDHFRFLWTGPNTMWWEIKREKIPPLNMNSTFNYLELIYFCVDFLSIGDFTRLICQNEEIPITFIWYRNRVRFRYMWKGPKSSDESSRHERRKILLTSLILPRNDTEIQLHLSLHIPMPEPSPPQCRLKFNIVSMMTNQSIEKMASLSNLSVDW